MLHQGNVNEKALMTLANHLTAQVEPFSQKLPHEIVSALKKALAGNAWAVDMIVQELLDEERHYHGDTATVETFNEILTALQQEALLKFLTSEIQRIHEHNLSGNKDRDEYPSLLKGMILFIAGQYENAHQQFTDAAKINPRSIMALYGRASASEQLGRPEEAVQAVEAALETDPDNTVLLLMKAKILDGTGRSDECIDFLFLVKGKLADNARYYSICGIAYIRKTDYAAARDLFEQGLLLDTASSWLWLLKAFTHAFEGNYSEAVKPCETALKISPDYWQALWFRGLLFACIEEYDKAEQYYRKTAQMAPEVSAINLLLIQLLQKMKKYEEAEKECELLLERNPFDCDVWVEKAKIDHTQKKWEKVVKTCSVGLEHCEDNAQLWGYMGSAHDSLQDYERSIQCYEKQIFFSKEDPKAWYGKGSVLLKGTVVYKDNPVQRGKWIQEALACGKIAVELDPTFSQGWYVYGLARLQSGDMETGISLLKKAADLGSFEAKMLLMALPKQRM